MKLMEIEPGVDYQFQEPRRGEGWNSYAGSAYRVTVLGFEEVNVEAKYSWKPAKLQTHVRVAVVRDDGTHGREYVVHPRQIKRPWSEVEQERGADEMQRLAVQEQADALNGVFERLEELTGATMPRFTLGRVPGGAWGLTAPRIGAEAVEWIGTLVGSRAAS